MLKSLFNKVAGLKVFNLIKKGLQRRCFHVQFAKSLRTLFYRTPPVAASAAAASFHVFTLVTTKMIFKDKITKVIFKI